MDTELRSPPAKKARTIITEEQNAIFRELFERGLRGTGKKYEALFQEAIDRTGLPGNVVKKKIYNIQRASDSNSGPPLRVSSMRRLSAYNVFCQMMGSQSAVKEDRHAIWGVMWSKQTPAQREFYEEEAKRRNSIPVADLTTPEKEELIKNSLRKIREHCTYLQQFESCHGFIIFTDGNGFSTSSCGEGSQILSTIQGDLQYRFNEAMETDVQPRISSKDHRMAMRKAAQKKINETYGSYLAYEGPRQFPYISYKQGTTEFGVIGLSPNLLRKRPCDMDDDELNCIMDTDFSFAAAYPEVSAHVVPHVTNMSSQEPGPSTHETSTLLTSPVQLHTQPSALGEEQVSHQEIILEGINSNRGEPPTTESVPTPSTSAVTLQIPLPPIGSDVVTEHILVLPPTSAAELNQQNIQTVPHPSNEEALHRVQQLAQAIEKSRPESLGTRPVPKMTKGFLQGLLGRTVQQEWKLTEDDSGNGTAGDTTGWFTGTIVKKNKTQFAIKFAEEEVMHRITAHSVQRELLKGTMIFVD